MWAATYPVIVLYTSIHSSSARIVKYYLMSLAKPLAGEHATYPSTWKVGHQMQVKMIKCPADTSETQLD